MSRIPGRRRPPGRRVVLGLPLLIVALLLAGVAPACRSTAVGLIDGHLAPCPSSPNCVCSLDAEGASDIAPLAFVGDPAEAWARLQGLVAAWPRATIVSADATYLNAEFRTAWLGFTDDVEFLLDAGAGAIQVRSASRLGWSDLGANRRRIEALREAWIAGA